jgi:hypothetical protein
MALGNIRERLKLHFDAEGSLESRVRDTTYEVHVRMPYRTAKSAAVSAADAAASPARQPARGEGNGPALREPGTGVSRG